MFFRSSCTNGMVAALLVVLSGCGSQGGLTVQGVVTFQGQPASAELSIEQLNTEGKPQGRAITAIADDRGRFTAQLSSAENTRVRLVVRVTQPPSDTALPAGFDGSPLGPKTVQLERDLSSGKPHTLAITR